MNYEINFDMSYLHIYMLMNLIRRYNHPYGQYLDKSIKQVDFELNQLIRLLFYSKYVFLGPDF